MLEALERATAPCSAMAREASFKALIAVAALSILLPFLTGSLRLAALAPLAPGGGAPAPILSSPTDPARYRHLVLPNGLPVTLVSDAATPKAAVALAVAVGSWGDPPQWPGLAHFLEHCLFLGSAPYPGENEYSAFLAAHGGGSNAFTSQDTTTYYFDVDAPHLEGALARFAGFFTAPLVSAGVMAREVNAVNAEHAKNLQSDGWRAWQLLKHLAAPASPLHAFSTGNGTTLDKPGVRAALLAFAAQHYHADNMVAAMAGPQSLEELGALALGALGGVRRGGPRDALAAWQDEGGGGRAAPWAGESAEGVAAAAAAVGAGAAAMASAAPPLLTPLGAFPVGGGARGLVTAFAPVGGRHELVLQWPVAGERSAFGARVDAAGYVAGVLNDGGAGGLLSALKRGGEVEGCSAGLDLAATPLALLVVQVQLAPGLVERVRGAGGAGAGAQLLLAAVGRITRTLLGVLDALEESVLEGAVEGWEGMVALARARNGLAGATSVARLAGVMGLSDGELAELSGGVGAARHGLLLRNSSSEAVQGAALKRAYALAARGAYRHYYSAAHEEGGVGGELLSWPPFFEEGSAHPQPSPPPPAAAAPRLWAEARTMAQAEWLYPAAQPSAEARVQALVKAMGDGLGPKDVLGAPGQRVWQPVAVLRLLRAMVPGAAIGLLCSDLLEEVSVGVGVGALSSLPPDGAGRSVSQWVPWGARPLEVRHVEPIYGTAFAQFPLAAALGEAVSAAVATPGAALPLPNPFLPTSWDLVDHSAYAAALHLPGTASRAWQGAGAAGARVFFVPMEEAAALQVWAAAAAPGSAPTPRSAATPPPAISTWWAPATTIPDPRLAFGLELLPAPNASMGSPVAALLSGLLVSVAEEGAREFLEPAQRAGAGAALGWVASTGALTLTGQCYTGSDACAAFLAAALRALLLPERRGGTGVPVLPRLALAVQEAVDAELQAQPYTQAFAEAALHSGERRWRGVEVLRAALGLVGGGGGEGGVGAGASELGAAFEAALAQASGSGAAALAALEARVAAALWGHVDAVLASVASVQVLLGGNVDAHTARTLPAAAMLPVVFSALQESRGGAAAAAAAAAASAAPRYGMEALAFTAAQAAAAARHLAPPTGALLLRPGSNAEDANGAAVTLLAGGLELRSPARAAALRLLGTLIREPAFDALRTKQALGYIASGGLRRVGVSVGAGLAQCGGAAAGAAAAAAAAAGCESVAVVVEGVGEGGGAGLGLRTVAVAPALDALGSLYVLVQGVVLDAAGMGGRVEEFLQRGFPDFLAALTPAEVAGAASALGAELRQAPKGVGEEFSEAWGEVVGHTLVFDRGRRLAEGVEGVSLEALRGAWEEVAGAARVRVQVAGRGGGG